MRKPLCRTYTILCLVYTQDVCHTATCTNNSDVMRHVATCTSNMMPMCTSTPNCSQRCRLDCCSDLSFIENTYPPSPILISHDSSDLDEEIVLQCSGSSTDSIYSEPNLTCSPELTQLSKTCIVNTICENSKTCPSSVDFAKEWICNKTFQLKHKIQDLVCQPINICESKHVDFTDSCDNKCTHDTESPCHSKSCKDLDIPEKSRGSCTRNPDNGNPCQAVKSVSYSDIACKLCDLCKHILEPISPAEPCRHANISDILCKHCKDILASAPCTSNNSCKYCAVGDKFCKHCKYILVSTACQPVKSFSYVSIAEKLCELCRHAINPAPSQSINLCKRFDIVDKLCEPCKQIVDFAPCRQSTPCKHCDITAKLCKNCKHVVDSSPYQQDKSCKLAKITDKVCGICKLVLDPLPFQPDPCKHCNITKKLCKQCKDILDTTPCQTDKSCKNIALAEMLCNHCKDIFISAPCPSVKSCEITNIVDKLCELCKHVVGPVKCQPMEICESCDITTKLCKQCKPIFDCQTDRSCRNIDIANKLCESCRLVYASAPCSKVKPCMKHVDISCKSNEQLKLELGLGKSVDPCEHCDISKKLCDRCKRIYDYVSCQADKTCKNADIIDLLCEHCRHVFDDVPCQPVKSCMKHVNIANKSCEQCKRDPCIDVCKKCDICTKLCKPCKRIYESVPCHIDRSCRNIDVANKLCEHCRLVFESAPCRALKSCIKYVDTNKSCEECEPNPAPCNHFNSNKKCDITKKLCKGCKLIFDSIPCADRSCKNIAFINRLCKHCRHHIESTACQPFKPCTKRITVDPVPCTSAISSRKCDITKNLCKGCKRIYDSAPCQDRSCKNVAFITKLCEHCRLLLESSSCQSFKPCKKHAIFDKSCEECRFISDSEPCKSIETIPCEPVNICKHCDVTKKLCKECKRIFDSVPCEDRSCKSVAFLDKLCEHCRDVFKYAPCPTLKPCMKHLIFDKSCEECKFISDSEPCNAVNPCKHCDITKKLCKECKRKFEAVPCADRSCKNVDVANMLCEHCRSIYMSANQPRGILYIADTPCERCKDVPDSALRQRMRSSKDVRVQVPEKGESCRKFEELFFNDQATGCSSVENWKCGKCACALESQSAATLTTLGSIIKQEAKSTCFDIAKESVCRSSGSGPESPGSSCASARARYYQNKLLATLQILQNKEETVRVQAESLAVAEARIAALNTRHTDLRRELERKEREIQSLRKSLKECRTCKVNTCDVSLTAEIQEMDDQKNIVTTLQNNLDVIEDLYQECFYESVKQESLIEMLRSSYLDVRLMDKEKSERISKLYNVISTQKWSLDRCQDIGTEVENLKMEISNFINSSNNDSGMWEDSVVSGLHEDLQDIAAQLVRLRDLLTGDCTCGLEQENAKLRQQNECLERDIGELRTQVTSLQTNLLKKELLDRQCQEQIEVKERELNCIRGQLHSLMEDTQTKAQCCDHLTQQLADTKALLEEKVRELGGAQHQCSLYEGSVKLLKEELDKSEQINKERGHACGGAVRGGAGGARAAPRSRARGRAGTRQGTLREGRRRIQREDVERVGAGAAAGRSTCARRRAVRGGRPRRARRALLGRAHAGHAPGAREANQRERVQAALASERATQATAERVPARVGGAGLAGAGRLRQRAGLRQAAPRLLRHLLRSRETPRRQRRGCERDARLLHTSRARRASLLVQYAKLLVQRAGLLGQRAAMLGEGDAVRAQEDVQEETLHLWIQTSIRLVGPVRRRAAARRVRTTPHAMRREPPHAVRRVCALPPAHARRHATPRTDVPRRGDVLPHGEPELRLGGRLQALVAPRAPLVMYPETNAASDVRVPRDNVASGRVTLDVAR